MINHHKAAQAPKKEGGSKLHPQFYWRILTTMSLGSELSLNALLAAGCTPAISEPQNKGPKDDSNMNAEYIFGVYVNQAIEATFLAFREVATAGQTDDQIHQQC